MKRQCRIWLPKLLTSTDDLSHSLLFGWFVLHSSSCLDVVVAFITDESFLSSNGGSSLQVNNFTSNFYNYPLSLAFS